jgi:hypothetical protein
MGERFSRTGAGITAGVAATVGTGAAAAGGAGDGTGVFAIDTGLGCSTLAAG